MRFTLNKEGNKSFQQERKSLDPRGGNKENTLKKPMNQKKLDFLGRFNIIWEQSDVQKPSEGGDYIQRLKKVRSLDAS